jgi:hypothetical protein
MATRRLVVRSSFRRRPSPMRTDLSRRAAPAPASIRVGLIAARAIESVAVTSSREDQVAERRASCRSPQARRHTLRGRARQRADSSSSVSASTSAPDRRGAGRRRCTRRLRPLPTSVARHGQRTATPRRAALLHGLARRRRRAPRPKRTGGEFERARGDALLGAPPTGRRWHPRRDRRRHPRRRRTPGVDPRAGQHIVYSGSVTPDAGVRPASAPAGRRTNSHSPAMLLVFDVGNTETVLGLFDDEARSNTGASPPTPNAPSTSSASSSAHDPRVRLRPDAIAPPSSPPSCRP